MDYLPMLQKLERDGCKITSLGGLLREPLTNGFFKRPQDAGRGTKLINVFDLYQDTAIDLSRVDRVEIGQSEIDKYRAEPGDIFFTRSSLKPAGVAWSAYLEDGPVDEAVFECHVIRARVDRRRAIPGYISNYARTGLARAYLISRAGITTMATIDQQGIRDLPVILPDLSRQAELLAALNTARSSRKEKLKKADGLLAGIDDEISDALALRLPPSEPRTAYAVKRKDIISSRCDALYHAPYIRKIADSLARAEAVKVPLGTLAPDLAGGATPTRGNQELYADSGVKFLRITNIAPFEISVRDVKFITEDVHNQMLERSQILAGDVLMTITGRVGTAAVVPKDILPANINQHIVRIRLADKRVVPEYLVAYLNSSIGLTMTNRGVTGGTRIALDYGAIRDLLIPVPKPAVQERIVAEVDRRLKLAALLRSEADELWLIAQQRFEDHLLGSVINMEVRNASEARENR
jgi:hypothetical protein